MIKRRIYLDTSVIGGCFDVEFGEESRKLFECIRVGIYTGLISSTTFGELKGAPLAVQEVLNDLDDEQIKQLPDDPRVPKLAAAYIAAFALPPSCEDDATHIAFATVYKADALVSWNFRHIVNLARIEE